MRALLRQLRFRSEWLLSPRLRGIYQSEPDRAVLEELKWEIAAGPFRGMRYITRSCGSSLAPKVIGCYERELHSAIEGVIAGDYERVIDVGCAEGYYAVGLAWRKRVPVVAFDTSAEARACLGELAKLNEVEALIDARELCTAEELQAFASERVFLICDIEGAEGELLDPGKAPALRHFDLLVEVHDGTGSEHLHDLLVARFEPTHAIETISYQGRSEADAGSISWVNSPEFRRSAVDEKRQLGLEWLLMKCKDRDA